MSMVKNPTSKVRRNLAPGLRPDLRMRRLRRHPAMRALVRETNLTAEDFVMPLFIKQGLAEPQAIGSMPGQFQIGLSDVAEEAQQIADLGIPAVILFGIPEYKNSSGSCALAHRGVVQEAIRIIKRKVPQLLVIADLCFCEYTSHGHCGIVTEDPIMGREVDNDQTLLMLGEQAVSLARAGADVVAPSGMMDGMVAVVRAELDEAGFTQTAILSYAVKYASSFYGPFREAAEGAPQFGDRRGYQMDPANSAEALREADQDIAEYADMLMVKPAQSYLDVVYRVKHEYPDVPLAAYQVSGEYAMIKAAAERGWIDEKSAMQESLLSIKRAGADFIITYFAKDMAALLQENSSIEN